jgi:hypothetical protein
LKNKVVGQLNLCVLVISPYFVLHAFFLEIEYLGTSVIFKMFYGLKIGAKTHFKTRSLLKLVFIKLQGYSVVIPLSYRTTIL